MGDWLVRGQFLDPNFNQDTLGKLSSRVVTIKEPTVVRAIPMPHDLHGPIGIIGAKIWGHGECCHRERGPKSLEGRLVAAHDIAVCCGCVLGCDLC